MMDTFTAKGHEVKGGDSFFHCDRCDGVFTSSVTKADHDCPGDTE